MNSQPTDCAQGAVSERHYKCLTEMDEWAYNFPGELASCPEAASVLAKHFPDQSDEIADLRERNDWLEGQREIAITERNNAHKESRELLDEIERLRAEVVAANQRADALLRKTIKSNKRVEALEEGLKEIKTLRAAANHHLRLSRVLSRNAESQRKIVLEMDQRPELRPDFDSPWEAIRAFNLRQIDWDALQAKMHKDYYRAIKCTIVSLLQPAKGAE